MKEFFILILIEVEESKIFEIKNMFIYFYVDHIEYWCWGVLFFVIEIVKFGINKVRGIE